MATKISACEWCKIGQPLRSALIISSATTRPKRRKKLILPGWESKHPPVPHTLFQGITPPTSPLCANRVGGRVVLLPIIVKQNCFWKNVVRRTQGVRSMASTQPARRGKWGLLFVYDAVVTFQIGFSIRQCHQYKSPCADATRCLCPPYKSLVVWLQDCL